MPIHAIAHNEIICFVINLNYAVVLLKQNLTIYIAYLVTIIMLTLHEIYKQVITNDCLN